MKKQNHETEKKREVDYYLSWKGGENHFLKKLKYKSHNLFFVDGNRSRFLLVFCCLNKIFSNQNNKIKRVKEKQEKYIVKIVNSEIFLVLTENKNKHVIA